MIEADTRRGSMLSPQDIAQDLNVSPETVQNWLNKKSLPGYKFAGLWRVKPCDYRKFLDAHYNGQELTPGEQRCYEFIKSRSPWRITAADYIPTLLAHQLDPNDLHKLLGMCLVKAIWMGDLTVQLVTIEADQSG